MGNQLSRPSSRKSPGERHSMSSVNITKIRRGVASFDPDKEVLPDVFRRFEDVIGKWEKEDVPYMKKAFSRLLPEEFVFRYNSLPGNLGTNDDWDGFRYAMIETVHPWTERDHQANILRELTQGSLSVSDFMDEIRFLSSRAFVHDNQAEMRAKEAQATFVCGIKPAFQKELWKKRDLHFHQIFAHALLLEDREEAESAPLVAAVTGSTWTTTISCEMADITKVQGSNVAVTNASNSTLNYGGGTAGALCRAGDENILRPEAKTLFTKYSKMGVRYLPAGSATVTGAGKMRNYKKIVHSIGPLIRGGVATQEDCYRLQKAYEQAFRVALIGGCDKIVLPFISCGLFSLDETQGMRIAIYSVLKAVQEYGIREVVFVNNTSRSIEKFKTVAKNMLPLTLQSRQQAESLIQSSFSDYQEKINQKLKDRIDQEIEKVFQVTQKILGSQSQTVIGVTSGHGSGAAVPTRLLPSNREESVSSERTTVTSARERTTGHTSSGGKTTKRRITPPASPLSAKRSAKSTKKRTPPVSPGSLRRGAKSTKRRTTPPMHPHSHKRVPSVSQTEGEESASNFGESQEDQDRDARTRMKAKLRQQRRRSKFTEAQKEHKRTTEAAYKRKTRLTKKKLLSGSGEGGISLTQPPSIAPPSNDLAFVEGSTDNNAAVETVEEYNARLEKHRNRISEMRVKQTPSQQSADTAALRERMSQLRQNATPVEKKRMQKDNREDKQRSRLARDERAIRRDKEKDKDYRAERRENETEEQTTGRRILDVLYQRKKRLNETPEQKAARRKRDAEAHYWHRHDVTRPLRKAGTQIITEEEKNFPQNLPKYFDLGPRPVCKYCCALTYSGRCCFGGQVHTRLPAEPPREIQELLVGNSSRAQHFRGSILAYNRSVQMASMTCERDAPMRNSNPFVKINGGIYHRMSGYRQPPGTRLALFNQVYQFNPEEATAERMKNTRNSTQLREGIVRELSEIMHKYNYLAKQFQTISKLERAYEAKGEPIPERIMRLRTATRAELQGLHPGVISRPQKELNSLLYRTDEHGSAPGCGVWVYKEGKRMTQLKYYDPLTDPLCYPLMFPYGEPGFRYGEDKLFPKGTTRAQAGFAYPSMESSQSNTNESSQGDDSERSTNSNEERDESTEFELDHNYEGNFDAPQQPNDRSDTEGTDELAWEHEIPIDGSDDAWELSSLTRLQFKRDIEFMDQNVFDCDINYGDHEGSQEIDARGRQDYDRQFEDELIYQRYQPIDESIRSESPVEFGYSSEDSEISDAEEDISYAQVNVTIASSGNDDSLKVIGSSLGERSPNLAEGENENDPEHKAENDDDNDRRVL